MTSMSRVWAMPSSETFDVTPIHNFVWKYLHSSSISIDPFARNRKWATYTNDFNPATTAEYHLEAADFLRLLLERGVRANLIIFDPPYSLEQCSRSYQHVGRTVREKDTQTFGYWPEHKRLCRELLENGGIFLHFGWHSNGMGKKHNFELLEIMLVAHGGARNDTICIAERKTQGDLL